MKKTTLILILLLGGVCGAQDLTNQLLVHYPFDGNTNDVSGNGLNATPFGATLAPDRFGNPDSSYYFDGNDDYINFPNVASLKPQLPMSFSFWVRYDSTSYQDQTVFNTSFEENRCTGVWFNSTSATSKPAVNYGDGTYAYTSGTRRTYVTDTIIDTNNWYHMIVVIKEPADMKIYVNCKEYGGVYSGSGGDIQYSDTPGCLGRHDRDLGLPPDYFKGYIDDFMYWDRELTTAEIALLCAPALAVTETSRQKFKAYPNPVDDILHIASESDLKSMSLTNAVGQLIFSGVFQPEMDVSHLSPGIYFLTCNDDAGTETKKIIVK